MAESERWGGRERDEEWVGGAANRAAGVLEALQAPRRPKPLELVWRASLYVRRVCVWGTTATTSRCVYCECTWGCRRSRRVGLAGVGELWGFGGDSRAHVPERVGGVCTIRRCSVWELIMQYDAILQLSLHG